MSIELNVIIENVADLSAFAEAIRGAVVSRLRASGSEKFSAIRLANVPLHYDDWIAEGRGECCDSTGIRVRQTEDALQLSGTVIHELAHAMVGTRSGHSEDWRDAANALGLTRIEVGQSYIESDFASDLLSAIRTALAALRLTRPTLFYDPNLPIPYPDGREPLPFQIETVRRMLQIRSSGRNILLAHEMGLGKTVCCCLYINATRPKSILIICPKSLTLSWKRHIEDWCDLPNNKEMLEEFEVASSGFFTFGSFVIMNYEAAVRFAPALKKMEWDLVIDDEMHYLKTPSSKRAKACYEINGKTVIGVTGSPIVNYFYEVFPLIHYLDRKTWPEYGRFKSEYEAYGERGDRRFGRNLNRLHAKLTNTIMIRYLKKNVLADLPQKRRQVIEIEPSPEIRKLIDRENELFALWRQNPDDAELAHLMNRLINDEEKSEIRNESEVATTEEEWQLIIETLMSTKSFAFSEMAALAHKIGQAKLEYAYEFIENVLENRERVAIFGHHRDVLQAIAKRFAPNSVLLLGGNTDQAAATQGASDKWQNDETCKVFVGQVSIAQGYSLKGGSTVIFIEEDWVPGLMTQAEDRMHGIGRGDSEAASLMVYHLCFTNSLDTYKAKLTIKKQKSIDRAMNR